MKTSFHLIDWKKEYELGVEDIDLQHHFFVNLINRLTKEFDTYDHPEYQSALIKELNAYACFHFLSEENIMFRTNYPLLQEHKQHHLNLLEQLSIKGNLFRVDPTIEKGQETMNFLTDWFFEHTNQEDRLFADYLHQKDIAK